jgi:hypothetical protein
MTTSNNDRSEYQREYRKQYKAQARRVNLTFSNSEYSTMTKSAKKADMSLAGYVKACALAAHHARADFALPEELNEELGDLNRVIRTIANNVNQMARHSHRIGQVLDDNEPFVYLHELEQALKSALAKAGQYHGPDHSNEDGA